MEKERVVKQKPFCLCDGENSSGKTVATSESALGNVWHSPVCIA